MGPQRRDRRVRRPDRRRHHRPRQGHAFGAAERCVDRRSVPDHRGRRRREARAHPRCSGWRPDGWHGLLSPPDGRAPHAARVGPFCVWGECGWVCWSRHPAQARGAVTNRRFGRFPSTLRDRPAAQERGVMTGSWMRLARVAPRHSRTGGPTHLVLHRFRAQVVGSRALQRP
ncbi:hypothetical protein CURTO8I2_170092 [Curtobacterium sp. 8I-2]|nr:hypothetical protein CURTO8I2_170092 [Curtobacterium sp. 8I-2]